MVWRGGFTIGEHLNSEPFLSDLYNKIKDNPALCNRILLLPTAVQVSDQFDLIYFCLFLF